MFTITRASATLAACLIAAAPGAAFAWEPTRPIEIIVGFSPGGSSDLVARTFAQTAGKLFPVPIVVVNRPGAASVIAAEYVAKQPADGHTLLLAGGSESTSVPNHRKVGYDISESFRPIINGVRLPIVISVKSDSKFQDFPSLVEYAKANPEKVTYGSSGVSGLYHSTMMVVDKVIGMSTYHVPYKGGADTVLAVLSSQVDITLNSPDEIKGQVDSGALKPIAVASRERYPGLPDVPTLMELGYQVNIENMKGLVAPAGLPDEVYEYLHGNFKTAMESDEFRNAMERANLEVNYLGGTDFGKALKNMSDTIKSSLE